jgi:hypothetical protein
VQKLKKMTRTKKLYGFRLGESIPKWKDRFGRSGGKIIQLIRLRYCSKFQVQISNGDIYTSEFLIQDDFHKRGLANER